MKTTFLSFILLVSAGCSRNIEKAAASGQPVAERLQKAESPEKPKPIPVLSENTGAASEEYADYYLVIVNSSRNYKALHADMFRISNRFHISIDTLGRYYNTETHAILVPEDDEDEIYRGEYYPRRFESLSLSIENADYYDDANEFKEPKKFPAQMILVAGMYAQRESADSLRNALSTAYPRTFVQKSRIYIGCMH